MLDAGFTDAYKKMHQKFEHSFPAAAYVHKTKNRNRIDYVFANDAAAKFISTAEIVKDSLTNTLSDHYPMTINFNKENRRK